jgi:site-specific recombinase XerC
VNKKGVAQGQKAAIAAEHVAAIKTHLEAHGSTRDRCLFAVAVDSMLRGCDLVRLRVGDLLDGNGNVRESFSVVQGKVSSGQAKPVVCYLTPSTRSAVAVHVVGKDRTEPLFTGKGRQTPMSTAQVRNLLKEWVEAVGLDPSTHSAHSLRRSKASALYRATRDLELVRKALGHAYLSSTQHYLSVGQDEVANACLGMSM